MERREFLSMVAIELACSDVKDSPTVYGFDTWHDLYQAAEEVEDHVSYVKDGYEELMLIEDLTHTHTIHTALHEGYNNAAWVLKRAHDFGVTYE